MLMSNVVRKYIFWLINFLALLTTAGFVSAQDELGRSEEIFATVGNDVITLTEYQGFIHSALRQRFFHGRVPDEQLEQLRGELAQQLIDQRLLQQEAQRRSIGADEAFVSGELERQQQRWAKAAIAKTQQLSLLTELRQSLERYSQVERLRQQLSNDIQLSATDVRHYYEANREKFTTPEKLRVSVILLAVEPWAPAATWQAAADEAQRLISKIEQGKATFEELARLHSSDASAAKGGDLGFIHRGMFADEAQQAVDVLQPAQLSQPVRLLKGIAVFRLDERTVAVLNDFDQVFERAQGLLHREQQAAAWQALLLRLRAETVIEINQQAVESLILPATESLRDTM